MSGPIFNFEHNYLSSEMLEGLSNYKYSAIDTNPLSIYIMHPFWNSLVKFCPKWIAPNLITFVGFLLTVVAFLLLSFYDFNFYATSESEGYPPIPNWVFFAVGVLIFVAYTLDGIDGKQARVTKTCGPLGELFDHGLDSWTAVLIPTCLYSVFGRSPHSVPPLRFYFVTWNVFLTFYLTHWEKYITSVLFLPWGYDLSMLSTTGVFLFTSWYGVDFWKIYVSDTISTGHVLEIIFYLTSICATLPVTLYNIRKSYINKTGKDLPVLEALRPLAALIALMFITCVWVITSKNDIINYHPRAFYMLTGTIFSNITCRLVIAQMSGTRCSAWNPLLNVLIIAMLVSLTIPYIETIIVYFLWAFVTYSQIHYGTCVVRQLCDHFRIECFRIKKQSK
ncbi:hypothetical protein O3M35_005804 [Rhynocoris fuscipes]|uniref:Ethanolaminephosphotransferase 1 n=1 Tax=Rhynocoris fuscipes TaxID=488301 RepID=A0AAW1DJX3_9HEMI